MSLVGAEPEPGPEPGRSYATGRLGPEPSGCGAATGCWRRCGSTPPSAWSRPGVGRDLPAPGHRLSGTGRAGRGGATRRRPGGLARPAGARARQLPAVLTWALSPVDGALPDGRLEIALRLGGALWRFWFMRDLLEGEHWLETALARVHAVAESPQPPQHAPPVPLRCGPAPTPGRARWPGGGATSSGPAATTRRPGSAPGAGRPGRGGPVPAQPGQPGPGAGRLWPGAGLARGGPGHPAGPGSP